MARPEGSVTPSSERRATILLVDDHPPNLMALEAILEPLGQNVLAVSSGAQAVEVAAASELAIVLLDLQMPELDGLETAVLLKKHARSKALPIIIVTADEPTRAQIASGYASGAVDFLSKPLDPDVIRSKVAVFVELWQRTARTDSLIPRSEEGSGRLSERLVAAAPPSEQAATVEALLRIHGALTEDLDVANLAQRLAVQARELTRAAGAAFHVRQRDGSWASTMTGRLEHILEELGPTSPVLAHVFQGGGIVRHDDGRKLSRRSRELARRARSSRARRLRGGRARARPRSGVRVRPARRGARRDRGQPRGVGLRQRAPLRRGARGASSRGAGRARASRRRSAAPHRSRRGRSRHLGLQPADGAAALGRALQSARGSACRRGGRLVDVPAEHSPATIASACRARFGARSIPATDMQFDIEYRALGFGDGVERWIAARGVGIAERGQAVRFIGAMLDVTAKKRIEVDRADILQREQAARAAAEQASRSKDEFLATVSHELRNPLNAILGWARVLVDERDLDAERRKKGLDVILRNAKTQVQLVEDILEVSRIITGKLRLSTGLVDVRTVVEAAVDTARAAATGKRVTIQVTVGEPLGTIVADEDRLQQILWNLLLNAVKFTPADGTVSLLARRTRAGDQIELVVTDTGEGIDPDFLPYVFDRFRQADGSTTRTHGGLGLALAIVRQLAELHGGTVRAESAGRGRGATFTVTLPAEPVPMSEGARDVSIPAPPASRTEPSVRKKPLDGRSVLVLDDDPGHARAPRDDPRRRRRGRAVLLERERGARRARRAGARRRDLGSRHAR